MTGGRSTDAADRRRVILATTTVIEHIYSMHRKYLNVVELCGVQTCGNSGC